jgi:hypothetical protein
MPRRKNFQSQCVDRASGCEAGNPRIVKLTDAEKARLPSCMVDECRRSGVHPDNIDRCLYCGALFVGVFDRLALAKRKVKLGYCDDVTDEMVPMRWLVEAEARRKGNS